METLRLVIVFFHLIGLAVLVGGFFIQLRLHEHRVTSAMLSGAVTMLITGPALIWSRRSLDLAVIELKMGVKLLVVIVVAVAAVAGLAGRRRHRRRWPFFTVGLLSIANLGVAVFWT